MFHPSSKSIESLLLVRPCPFLPKSWVHRGYVLCNFGPSNIVSQCKAFPMIYLVGKEDAHDFI